MSLDKTIKHNYRLPTDFEKYPVYDALPLYFETEFPKLIAFLEKYYDFSDGDTGFGGKLHDLEVKRDLVEARDEILSLFSEELLLGRNYFDRFIDKKTAVAVSNLLYRSKGTKYSVQQFFRVFFGFDVEVRYGRDEVFLVGDPLEELLIYKAEYKADYLYPGRRLRFEFDDGDIQVSALRKLPEEILHPAPYVVTTEDYEVGYSKEKGVYGSEFLWSNTGYNEIETYDGRYAYTVDDYVEPFTRELIYDQWVELRQDIDYSIDYADKSVVLKEISEGYEPVHPDPWITDLSEYGVMREEGQSVKIDIKRNFPASSPIGPDVSEKRITNNGFWQMFSILIKSPVAMSSWKEAYKDFVHPAGMYLEGQVILESVAKLGIAKQNNASTDQYRKLVESTLELNEFVYTMVTELNLRPGTAKIIQMNPRGAPNNPWLDSDGTIAYPDEIYRSRINDISRLTATLEELDAQYDSDLGMARIDDISPRTFIETSIDMSNTINTLDENVWHKEVIENFCPPQHVLGSELDYPMEWPGCPNYIFAVGKQTVQGQYHSPKLMNEYYYGDSAPAWAVDPDHPQYIGEQFRTTPGPVNGVVNVKFTAYRDNRVWDDYVADDYTIEIPSATPSSKWIGNTDYANRFQRAQVNATVAVFSTYFQGGYMYANSNAANFPDDRYMELHQDSDQP